MKTSATPSPTPPTTNISSPVWAPRQRTVSWWGNDVDEDMGAAKQAGLSVFLLTDCLINREGKDITPYSQGDFDALMGFVQSWA